MLGRNRIEAIEPESKKLVEIVAAPLRVELIHREENRFIGTAQFVDCLAIQRIKPTFAVQKKNHHIRFRNRQTALRLNALFQSVSRVILDSAGVDE